MPNPIDNEDLYDSVQIDGEKSPGFVTLSGHDRNEKWDVKESDGHAGASSTYKGENITQFQASFYLVKDPVLGVDEFAEWDAYSAKLRAALPTSGSPKALLIYHPDLLANGITVVQIAGIGGMQHDGKGGATVVVKFLEYRPVKKKGGTAKGAKPSPARPDPNADLKKELDGLLTQARTAA